MPLYRKSSCVHYSCLLTSSFSWLFLLCTVGATLHNYWKSNCAVQSYLLYQKASYLESSREPHTFIFICSCFTLRKVTHVEQYVHCYKTSEDNAAGQQQQHTAGAAAQLLSPASFNLFSKRRLQTSCASPGLPCSALTL